MAPSVDTVPVRIDDPMCQGVTSPDGRIEYPKDRHGLVHVPRAEAQRLLASGHPDTHRYRPTAAFGLNPRPDLQAAYDHWCQQRPGDTAYVPYVAWYRDYREEVPHVDPAERA